MIVRVALWRYKSRDGRVVKRASNGAADGAVMVLPILFWSRQGFVRPTRNVVTFLHYHQNKLSEEKLQTIKSVESGLLMLATFLRYVPVIDLF